MQPFNIQRFGLAVGVASVLLYVGCVIGMAILGKNGTIAFFNNLFHCLDVRLIIKMNIPLRETIIGTIETFILGWLFGVVIALFTNFAMEEKA